MSVRTKCVKRHIYLNFTQLLHSYGRGSQHFHLIMWSPSPFHMNIKLASALIVSRKMPFYVVWVNLQRFHLSSFYLDSLFAGHVRRRPTIELDTGFFVAYLLAPPCKFDTFSGPPTTMFFAIITSLCSVCYLLSCFVVMQPIHAGNFFPGESQAFSAWTIQCCTHAGIRHY